MVAEPPAIAIFARAPVPGQTKTRLIPRLGAAGAATLHRAMVEQAIRTAQQAALGPVTLFCAPDTAQPFFVECSRRFGIALARQIKGDLGERMLAAFEALAPGAALLIGTDLPALTPHLLREAAAALAGADAVFLPTEDGGYGLVGLHRPQPSLFRDMTWSTPGVMDDTRRRLQAAGLTWREPATLWDVDRPEDVDRLRAAQLLPDWQP
jgi:uncharacterized protein